MTFTLKRVFGTHMYSIYEDGVEIASLVKEANAQRIIAALEQVE